MDASILDVRLVGLDGEQDRMRIRALRARPPARASNAERRPVFCAALGQFDELLTAAAAIGPAARPLPLYYALHQAGRAIIAARQSSEQPWQPKLHGLSVGGPDEYGYLQGTPIKPQTSEDGAFRQLAEALAVECLTQPTTLANVWAAIPGLPYPGLGASCPRPLPVTEPSSLVARHLEVRGLVRFAPGDRVKDAVYKYMSDTFPRAADGLRVLHVVSDETAPVPSVTASANVLWNRSDGRNWRQASAMEYLGGYYLVPRLNKAGDVLDRPILLWWCLLQALSSLARYNSAEWVAALQPDTSDWCISIETALATALEIVPRLVYTELVSPRPVSEL